jgi:hypothetical protein
MSDRGMMIGSVVVWYVLALLFAGGGGGLWSLIPLACAVFAVHRVHALRKR